MSFFTKTADLIAPDRALPGRAEPIPTASRSFINDNPLHGPYPAGLAVAHFAMGCFWGVERKYWQTPGVWVTVVGYMGGFTPNPTYQETCTGRTGHTEVVRVVYDPAVIAYDDLLKMFWEGHDPTQGMRQGGDIGSQYRSGVYTASADEAAAAEASRGAYQAALIAAGRKGEITTEIATAGPFYFAEDYHQQYLAKNPDGYCGGGGVGVVCPIGVGVRA